MRWRGPQDDTAAGDFIGTLLMVALVVTLGGVVGAVAIASLKAPAPVDLSMSALEPREGDAALGVLHAEGPRLALSDLRVLLARNASDPVEVPRASWSTPDATHLRPGDRLGLPLSPPAAPGERLSVVLLHNGSNTMLATVGARVALAAAPPVAPQLAATLAPADLTADGVATAVLSVRVSHPMGALAVGGLVADLGSASLAAGAGPLVLPLRDDGQAGDAVAGDGVWSGLVALPSRTPLGNYTFLVNATDPSGRLANTTSVQGRVLANGTGGAVTGGAVTGGMCYGCVVQGGARTYEGTRLFVPASENITRFQLTNWTTDKRYPQRLDDDYVLFRIVSEARGWSCQIRLEEFEGKPYAIGMRVWSELGETEYVPRNMTGSGGNALARLPLDNLTLEMMRPVESLQWVVKSGDPHPKALYQHAGLAGDPVFIVTYMGQDETTGNVQKATYTGIFSFDVEVTG